MKKVIFPFSFALIILLLIIIPASAAQKGKNHKKPKIIFTVEPFDNSLEILPPQFVGNDYFEILKALLLNSKTYKKGEFEKTDEFTARMENLRSSTLYGKLHYDSLIAFGLKKKFTELYNADTENMQVTLTSAAVMDDKLSDALKVKLPPGKGRYSFAPDTRDAKAIEVYSFLRKTKKYTGSNAFGVKAKITAEVYEIFSLAIPHNFESKEDDDIRFAVKLNAEKAPEAKLYGSILLVGHLLRPFWGKGSSHSTATISYPRETLNLISYIGFGVKEVWYYNFKTGEVYHKELLNKLADPSESDNE